MIKKLEEIMSGKVTQYKKAAKSLLEFGYYRRSRCYRPQEGLPGHEDIYWLAGGEVQCIAYNTSRRRALVILRAYQSGKINLVDPEILHNYANNGWMTRRGLYASYNQIARDRIEQIARSHADYLGNETGSSSADHSARKKMR